MPPKSELKASKTGIYCLLTKPEPRIPSHLLKKIKSVQPEVSPTPVPTTYSGTLEAGIEEEEHGDRWIISDLSKTIRFYNKAIEFYIKSIQLNPSGLENFDAWFNKSRLNFHIYSTLKDINIEADLKSVAECEKVLNISLNDIVFEHEDIIKRFNDDERIINWDFYYDYGLVLIEVVETAEQWNSFEELEIVVNNGIQLFNKILDLLTTELDGFISNLNGGENMEDIPNSVSNDNNDLNSEEPEEYTMMEQVTPKVVFDAVLTSLRFAQVSLEATENTIQLEYFKALFLGLLKRCEEIKHVLIDKFNPNNDNANGLNLSSEEVFEFELIKHSIEGVFINDFANLVVHWDQFPCTDSEKNMSSRYLSESDSFQTFKEHFIDETNYELQWEIIGHINKRLSIAQELIKKDLQEQINSKTSLISNKVSKSIEILIIRADNELKRFQFDNYSKSIENRDLLRQNIVALLKNGLSLSKTRCGLRETILDRLKREKLGRECVIRLVLFTKDSYTEEDLIRNLGRQYYRSEIEDIKDVDVYKQYLK